MCGAYGFSIHDAKEVYDRFAVVNQLEDSLNLSLFVEGQNGQNT